MQLAEPGEPPVFRLIGGTVTLDGTPVLDALDVSIEPGSFVVVLGANGSGKTTLIRTLLGLQPLTSGRVELYGQPLSKFRDWQRISFVPQRLPAATGVPISALELVTSAWISPRTRWHRDGHKARRAAEEALELVDLSDRKHARMDTLSGGQQRRVMIARSLAEGADTLVMDEPLSGVDLANQQHLAALLATLSGRTIVMVAHGLGSMAPLVNRAIVLDQGTIVHDGPHAPAGWIDVHHHNDGDQPATLLEG